MNQIDDTELDIPVDLDTLDLSEPPEFSFMGTDGETYLIGRTPRSFEREIVEFISNQSKYGFDKTTLIQCYDVWDKWIWQHIITVPTQRGITFEKGRDLYFAEDRGLLMEYIARRFQQSQTSSIQALNAINDTVVKFSNELNGTTANGD